MNEFFNKIAQEEIIKLKLENLRLKEQLKEVLLDLNMCIKEREKK